MEIKVIGEGCEKCDKLYENTLLAIEELGLDAKIEKVEVKDHKETAGIADGALEEVPAAIVKQNKADVDTVSGATLTSNAIITATKDALKKAAK